MTPVAYALHPHHGAPSPPLSPRARALRVKTQVSTLVGAGVGGILVASLLGATPWRSGPSSVHGGSGGFAGSSSARRVRGLGAGEEVGAAAADHNGVECRIWSCGRQRRQLWGSAVSGPAGKSERRLRGAPLCCGVSVLVVWMAESSTRMECGLRADMCEFLWFVSQSGGSGSCGGVATLVVWATGKSAR